MKKTFFAIVILGLAYSSYAQFSAGVKTGIAFNNLGTNGFTDVIDPLSSSMATGHIGIFGEYALSEMVDIRAGVSYTRKGTELGVSTDLPVFGVNIPVGLNTRFTTAYLEFPLTANFNYSLGSQWTAYATAGGGISAALSSRLRPRANLLINFNLPDVTVPTEQINQLEAFGIGGLGAAYQTTTGKIFAEVQYQHSFESIKPDFLVDLDLRNKGFSVGVGYAMSF